MQKCQINRFNTALGIGVIVSSSILILANLSDLISGGGGGYQQADWLINSASGPVRRGISGDSILALSAFFELRPLLVVGAIQAFLTISVIAGLMWKSLSLGMSDRLTLLLISPALVLFWLNDPGGGYRKELLGYAAFLPLLTKPTDVSGQVAAATFAAVTLSVAVWFHEANVFFCFPITMALWFSMRQGVFIVAAVVIWSMAVGAAIFALRYPTVPDTGLMCGRLREVGLGAHLCTGIFDWLARGLTEAKTAEAMTSIVANTNFQLSVTVATVCFVPLLLMANSIPLKTFEKILFWVSLISIAPLYALAIDWGRWLSFQFFSGTFVLMIAKAERGSTPDDGSLPRPIYIAFLVFSLSVGISHFGLEPIKGFVFQILELSATSAD